MIAPTAVRMSLPPDAGGVIAPFASTQRRQQQAGASRARLRRQRRPCTGRTLTVYDTAGQGLTYGLDSANPPSPRLRRTGRVTSVAQSAPNITGTRTVTYELDKAGNKTRAIWPDSYYVSYQFDDINRMTTVTENGTFVLATYVWDPLSRRASLAYGNGTTQSYSYSKAGDLETHTHTITGNSNTWTNSYTKAHQLLSEAASNAAWVFQPAVNETTSYGNANNLNQYVTVTHAADPMATLYYDGNGNLIDDGVWDFEYDAENRLTKASNATTGTTAQYLYDPMGRRQAKVVGSVTTSFLSDGAEEIAEYDGAGGLLRRYIPGPGTDQPIAMVTPSGGSHQHSYFHTNRQGSTIAMSNDAGTVSEGPYTYDAYGQGAPSTGVPFKYTGRRLDPETGLYYYRARYYSAALGRFLQTDPIGYKDQMNLYAYVGNDPVNWIDPSGMCAGTNKTAKAQADCRDAQKFVQQNFDINLSDKNMENRARDGLETAAYDSGFRSMVTTTVQTRGVIQVRDSKTADASIAPEDRMCAPMCFNGPTNTILVNQDPTRAGYMTTTGVWEQFSWTRAMVHESIHANLCATQRGVACSRRGLTPQQVDRYENSIVLPVENAIMRRVFGDPLGRWDRRCYRGPSCVLLPQ